MAREFVQIIKCDICQHEVSEIEVQSYSFTWEKSDYEIETCLKDGDRITDLPLKKLLDLAHRTKAAARSSRRSRSSSVGRGPQPATPEETSKLKPCPVCGYEAKSQRGLTKHKTDMGHHADSLVPA